jgi:integrase
MMLAVSVRVVDLKRDGNWWVETRRDGQRARKKIGPDRAEAEAIAAELRRRQNLRDHLGGITFRDFVDRWLEEDLGHLAPTTARDRRLHAARLVSYFGDLPLTTIRRPHIREWWGREIEAMNRSAKTGRNYLDTLGAIFHYALELEVEDFDVNPVASFRATLRRRRRTKAGRLEATPGRHVAPIETPGELSKLLETARELDTDDWLMTLVLLDAGPRLGEAGALRWGDVWWGRDGTDTSRSIHVQRSRSRGQAETAPKAGRSRRVHLSRRLRRELLARWIALGRPDEDARIFPNHDPSNYRKRFLRACHQAKIGHRRPKDLRDTFASWLLTFGAPLGYISAQLGHASVDVTARHYARWCGSPEDGARVPIPLEEGSIYPDLLERLGASDERGNQRSPDGHRHRGGSRASSGTRSKFGGLPWAAGDSNPQPSG